LKDFSENKSGKSVEKSEEKQLLANYIEINKRKFIEKKFIFVFFFNYNLFFFFYIPEEY
jgi:hypothetical protein